MGDVERAIHELHERFLADWARHDAAALAAWFTEDGVRVGVRGDTQRGRAEIVAAFRRLFEGPLRGAVARTDGAVVRPLGDDHALWRAGLEIAPLQGAPLRGRVVDVMVRSDGGWRILESHPSLFPPEPPA